MEYTVAKVTSPEDKQKVDEFVHAHFLRDMPLIAAFGVEDSAPPRPPAARAPSASEAFYIQAVDSQGDIIGIAINRVNTTIPTTDETPPEVKKMVEFLSFVEEDAELDKLPEGTIELRVLSVRKEWRQRGVARRLAEESVRVARESGFKAMRVCCTSEFTAKLARSLGWREHYRLAFKDYPRVSGREVYLKPTPPHDYLYYYVTDL